MNDVKAVDENAHKWILKNDVTCWSRIVLKTNVKSYHITNNISESFNQWLRVDRELFILSLLELCRRRVVIRMRAR